MWFPQKKAKISKKSQPTNPLKEEVVHKGQLNIKINTTRTTNTNSNETFKLKPRWLVLTDTKLKIYKTSTDSSEDEVLDFSQKGFICGISNLQRDVEETTNPYLVIFNLDSSLGIIASAENREILSHWLSLVKERNGIKEDTPAIHNYLNIIEETLNAKKTGTICLNRVYGPSIPFTSTQNSIKLPNELSEYLLTTLVNLTLRYTYILEKESDNLAGFLFKIRCDREYKERFVPYTSELQKLPKISHLTNDEKIAFFVNIYHALLLHSFIEVGDVPCTLLQRVPYYKRYCYRIGSMNEVTLYEIEHVILRSKSAKYKFLGLPILGKVSEEMSSVLLTKPEPRISFVLSPFSLSGPSVNVISAGGNVSKHLAEMTCLFLDQEVSWDDSLKTVYLPKIMKWYKRDFGGKRFLLDWVSLNISETKRDGLIKGRLKYSVTFRDYNWNFGLYILRDLAKNKILRFAVSMIPQLNLVIVPIEYQEIVQRMMMKGTGISIHDRVWRFKTYKQCFVASEFIDWMVGNFGMSQTKAIETAAKMHEAKIFSHVTDPKSGFRFGYFFYRMNPELQADYSEKSSTIYDIALSPRRIPTTDATATFAKRYENLVLAMLNKGTGLTLKNRKHLFTTYKQCFVGSELIDWIVKYCNLKSRGDALVIGTNLHRLGLFEHAIEVDKPLIDGYYFYRFTFEVPDERNVTDHYSYMPSHISKENLFGNIQRNLLMNSQPMTDLDLTGICLDSKEFQVIVECLRQNTNLVKLNLSHNEIADEGVEEILELFNLNETVTNLDLSFNDITLEGAQRLLQISKKFMHWHHIYIKEWENFQGIKMAFISSSIDIVAKQINLIGLENQYLKQKILDRAESISITDRTLVTIPINFLLQSQNLKILDLSRNNITTLPTQIDHFQLLEELHAPLNEIAEIPTSIVNLHRLRILNLNNNNITVFPDELSTATQLQVLHLNNNPFNFISLQTIAAMSGLVDISFSSDLSLWSAKHVPAEIVENNMLLSYVRNLVQGSKSLYRMNLFFVGPPSCGRSSLIKNLVNLPVVSRRRMTSKSLAGTLRREKGDTSTLRLRGDTSVAGTLRNRSESLAGTLRGKPDALLSTSNLLSPGRAHDSLRVESSLDNMLSLSDMLSLGSEGSSRSSYNEEDEHLDLEAIDITQWRPEVSINSETIPIDFTCWDAKGDASSYVTRQLFFGGRSLFLLVFSQQRLEEAVQKLSYWLQLIRTKAPNSSVILVGTYSDKKPLMENNTLEYVAKKCKSNGFSNVKKVLGVSNKTYKGFDALQLAIHELAKEERSMGEKVPAKFLALEDSLHTLSTTLTPPIITWQQYKDIGLKCNIPESDLMSATKFLRDLGSLMYFEREPSLKGMVIISVPWIISCVVGILQRTDIALEGVLRHKDLRWVLNTEQYPSSCYPLLLDLLEKLEILHNDKQDQKCLVPFLFPDKNETIIDIVWTDHQMTYSEFFYSRIYTFSFFPVGFFTQFILIMLASTQGQVLYYWNNGIIMQVENEQVLIECVRMNELHISMRGSTKVRKYSVSVLEAIENYVSVNSHESLEYEVKVPCSHCTDKITYFDIGKLKEAVAKGHAFIYCQDIYPIRIDSLAFDVTFSDIESLKVEFDDIQIECEVGKGGFATVYKGTYRGQSVAIKKINFPGEDAPTQEVLDKFNEFRREVSLMSGLSHPNIVTLKAMCVKPFCMITEYLPYGDLYRYLHNRSNIINFKVMLKMAVDVASGMNFLHSTTPPLVHRDLKSPNILMSAPNLSAPVLCKVSDFGMSRRLTPTTNLYRREVMNPYWLAPEIMSGSPYSDKCDVYSFGVILWELYTRKHPFEEFNFTFMMILEEKIVKEHLRPTIPQECPENYADLIKLCWHPDPNQRPAFNVILNKLQEILAGISL